MGEAQPVRTPNFKEQDAANVSSIAAISVLVLLAMVMVGGSCADSNESSRAEVSPSKVSAQIGDRKLVDEPTDDSAEIRAAADRVPSGVAGSTVGTGEPTVEDVLEHGLKLAGASPVHLAVRGTAGADTVRCAWRGIARTAAQRELAIRFWLRLGTDDGIPDASVLEALFTAFLDTLNPDFRETAKSNFLAIARGGLSEEYLFLTCFADYTVSSAICWARARRR